jgi:methylated-DNA-[protein]-cysteine S-methyltransferase
MSESLETQAAVGTAAPPEPVRVLVPSALGQLGIALLGQAIARLVIAPTAKERRLYTPLAKMKRAQMESLDEILGRLSEYFAGARRNLEIEHDLGPSGVDLFARRVLKETAKIPYGKTRTYQAIAEAAGRPEAYRQALSILMANPIPVVIPCHRVVPSKGGGVGNYIAGVRKKQWLLRLEEQVAARS